MIDRTIALIASLAALVIGARALFLLYVHYGAALGMPQNLIPASAAGKAAASAPALLDPATEQLFILLVCLIVLILARVLRTHAD